MSADPSTSTGADDLTQQLMARLAPVVLELLRAHPAGVQEVAVLRALESAAIAGFDRAARGSAHGLFRCHFMLFHVLYRLRTQLPADTALDIDCCCIRLRTADADPGRARAGVQRADPLQTYYLDLANLDMSEAEVDALLNRFWRGLGGEGARAEALAVLDLAEPVDAVSIKRRYRELAMQRHPDRGGSTEALQTLNAAVAVLLPR